MKEGPEDDAAECANPVLQADLQMVGPAAEMMGEPKLTTPSKPAKPVSKLGKSPGSSMGSLQRGESRRSSMSSAGADDPWDLGNDDGDGMASSGNEGTDGNAGTNSGPFFSLDNSESCPYTNTEAHGSLALWWHVPKLGHSRAPQWKLASWGTGGDWGTLGLCYH